MLGVKSQICAEIPKNQKCASFDTARGGDYRLQGDCDNVSKVLDLVAPGGGKGPARR